MRQNTEKLGLEARAKIVQSDWATNIVGDKRILRMIASSSIRLIFGMAILRTLSASVRDYEPHLALDGGADGLDCYRILNAILPVLCDSQTKLLLEIGAGQEADVIAAMNNFNYLSGKCDLGGVMRALSFAPIF